MTVRGRTGRRLPVRPLTSFTLVWGAGFTKEIEEILALDGQFEAFKSLSYRLVDAYGLFDLLISKNQSRAKKRVSKSTKQEGSVA